VEQVDVDVAKRCSGMAPKGPGKESLMVLFLVVNAARRIWMPLEPPPPKSAHPSSEKNDDDDGSLAMFCRDCLVWSPRFAV
jgi:hypothetical protein